MSEALEILKSCDAFLEGHFLLSSGRHSSAYCQMAYLQQYPDRCAEVMKAVADKIKEMDVDVIVGPAMGGIVYAYELGRQMGKRAIFTERVDNVMTLKRFKIHPGERCVIAEDVVTTGLWRGEEDYDRIPLQTVNGVTIAYLSYTEHTNGIRQNKNMTANIIYTSQTDVIERQVRLARQQADFVVVGVHWGVEDSHAIVDSQRTLAQNLADWGADVIVGTHPHVLQDAQWLTAADGRRSFVAFSLGNFLSTQSRPDQLVGAILTLQLQKTTQPNGSVQCEVLEPQLHPTVTHYDAGKTNVRTYFLSDYTQELAAAHGVRANYSDFSLDRIQNIAQNNISASFLVLT